MTGSAFLLMLALASPAILAAPTETEIVVTGQVTRVGLTLGRDDRGTTSCSLTRSSGDPAIDEAMCRRASRCIKRGPVVADAVDACIAHQKTALVAAWLRGERQ